MTSGDPSTRAPSESEQAPNPADERRRALAPYLAALVGAAQSRTAGSAVPDSGAWTELDPWERGVLLEFHDGTDAEGRPWPGLVAEGVAFRAKCLASAAELDADAEPRSPEQRVELVDELVRDAAVGVAVLQELQWAIDRLIRETDLKTAKSLTDFRNGISHSLGTMRRLIGSDAFATATRRASSLVTPPVERSAPAEEPEVRRPAPQQFKRDAAPVRMVYRRAVKKRRTIWVLLAILLAAIAAWVVLMLSRPDYTPPPALTDAHFRHVEAFLAVTARPPSVYVTLDAARWRRLSERQRREVLDEIGAVADRGGYSGVHARTSEGVPVGQWLKQTGARVFPPPVEGS